MLPGVVVVRLAVSFEEAERRARTRAVHLTDEEFRLLHQAQSDQLAVDHVLEFTRLDRPEQLRRVRVLWASPG